MNQENIMRSKKFVLDANIWISYFITNQQGKLEDIIIQNKILILYCAELIAEISRVLNYQRLASRNVNIISAVNFVKSVSVFHSLEHPVKNYIPGDDADNYIIALALQTNSGFVTSGDKHILSQKKILETKYRKLQIISKTEFEQMFVSTG